MPVQVIREAPPREILVVELPVPAGAVERGVLVGRAHRPPSLERGRERARDTA